MQLALHERIDTKRDALLHASAVKGKVDAWGEGRGGRGKRTKKGKDRIPPRMYLFAHAFEAKKGKRQM